MAGKVYNNFLNVSLIFCQLQEFVVQGLHKARVTCSNWSLNGMKLFTGDDQGLVVCTEFDAFQVINIKRVYSVYCGIIILIRRLQMYSLQFYYLNK